MKALITGITGQDGYYLSSQLLEKGYVTTPEDLIDESVRGWTAGSRSRQQAVRNLAAFLSYCVKRKKFPVQWDTTFLTLKDHIGVIPKSQKKKRVQKQWFKEQTLPKKFAKKQLSLGTPRIFFTRRYPYFCKLWVNRWSKLKSEAALQVGNFM